MKYITPLALFAIALFSSTANAALDLCPRNDKFVFPEPYHDSEHEICLDIRGEFKVDMPAGSEIVFLAKKGDIKRTWSVDLYLNGGALRLPESDRQPIPKGFSGTVRVCSYLPSEFKYIKQTEIQFGVQILRPGKQIAICLGGDLKLL
ncbi:hypothetical protein KI688_000032 [Linnemannia hyalina]|uniref:Uncharacterized protein n=1 Tax=Linnemannia hyalina TaxID=64524 RepID=A0A9P8BYB6_9FUNG|nr:hypothetical protein KI688_000032 [Linnemannia hyalina]